jgi:hypothetical protein
MARRFSMRPSGISQISAAIRKIVWAIHEDPRVAMIATIYSIGESLPFQSRPNSFGHCRTTPVTFPRNQQDQPDAADGGKGCIEIEHRRMSDPIP